MVPTRPGHWLCGFRLLVLSAVCWLAAPACAAEEDFVTLGGDGLGWAGWQNWEGWRSWRSDVSHPVVSGNVMRTGRKLHFRGEAGPNTVAAFSKTLPEALDLQRYAGILVVVDSLPEGTTPMALQLELQASDSVWTYASPFAVQPGPPGATQNLFLTTKTFQRPTFLSQRLGSHPVFAKKLTVSLPGQEGAFDIAFHRFIAIRNIEDAPRGPPPTIQLNTAAETSEFISATLGRGARLYDAFFTELSAAVLSAGLQSVAASKGPEWAIKSHICQGLKSASAGAHSYEELSWRLRRLLEAVDAALNSRDAPEESSYPAAAQGAWVNPPSDVQAGEACPPLGETSFGTTELYALSARDSGGSLGEDALIDYPMLPKGSATTMDTSDAAMAGWRARGLINAALLSVFSFLACTFATRLLSLA